jgi:hypothetical protein
MQLTPEQQETIIGWAEDLPKATAVFVLGARARGTANSDSDIELGLSLGGMDSWWNLLTFLNHRRSWRTKLEKRLGLRVHLELMELERATNVHPGKADNIALWRRH